jgi:hypothetical protein
MTNEARLAGQGAETRVVTEFDAAGWRVRQSAVLDYASKADLQVACPGYASFLVQVSIGPKSVGEQERLATRGVLPLSAVGLDNSGMTAPEYACTNWCQRELCADQLGALPLQVAEIDYPA